MVDTIEPVAVTVAYTYDHITSSWGMIHLIRLQTEIAADGAR
jgi:hypothetical protein